MFDEIRSWLHGMTANRGPAGESTDAAGDPFSADDSQLAEESQFADGQSADAGTTKDYRPLTRAMRQRMAARPPSFTELLPWTLFDADTQTFDLNDGASVGALFEITPKPSEAMPQALMEDCRRKIQDAINNLPESETAPWVVQFYVNDDRNIDHLKAQMQAYIHEVHRKDPERANFIAGSALTQAVLSEFDRHLQRISQPQGLFVDKQVTGNTWRGQVRRVRMCLYRVYGDKHDFEKEALQPSEALNRVATNLVAGLAVAGIQVRRCTGRDLYEWMFPFFNRKGSWKSPSELMRQHPYAGDVSPEGSAPILGWDLAEMMNLQSPQSDPETGCMHFDGVPVRALTLQRVSRNPEVGALTAERGHAEATFAQFDQLPANSMLSMTVVIKPQNRVQEHVQRILDASKARTAEARRTHGECERILEHMATGDKLYPIFMVLYLSGDDDKQLMDNVATVSSQLSAMGLEFIKPEYDLVALDAFVRGLPMCFSPEFDARTLTRGRLLFSSHVAALAPLYGRNRGTGHPGFPVWNRGGEPLWFDPLNKADRKKNAHLLCLGPTGAGKSATLNLMTLFTLAIHRPRMFIADAGKSFGLLKEFVERYGLTTHYVELTPANDVSLPPFALAPRMLEELDKEEALALALGKKAEVVLPDAVSEALESIAEAQSAAEDDAAKDDAESDEDEEDKRDYLGEMQLSAVMMITGGEAKEIDKLTRADRYTIADSIVRAARAARAAGKPHPLVEDVANELLNLARDESLVAQRRQRASEMGEAMKVFTQGLRGKLFNRFGQEWPDADFTLLEMGTVTLGGYEDALSVAYSAFVDQVQAVGEKHQYGGRDTVLLTDEGHLILTNPLLGPKIVKGTKMWRKLGIWFWLATQDMKDFPDSMSRVLNMCEWWILLSMEIAEIAEVARFKKLTNEQRSLMASARKDPPRYTEGVVLTPNMNALFRNVSPALPVALAMTERHEKAERRALMKEHGCTELEAAVLVARRLEESRL